MTIKKPKPGAEVKEIPRIYCGPSLPNGLMARFTVYRGGLPPHLNEQFESCPALKQLIVPVEKLAETVAAINTTGSAESTWHKEIQAHFNGGVR